MEIVKAVELAENDEEVKEHVAKGFYLSSVMAIPETLTEIKQWTLVYFHPETQKVFSVEVTDDSVKKGEASTPLIEGHYDKLDHAGALAAGDLLAKLLDIIAEQKEVPTRVIITLREKQWKVAVVTQSLKMLRIDMDMKTGEPKNIEKTPLVKPL